MWKTVFKTTLIAGTLDILTAFANSYITRGVLPGRVLQFIASGVFGKTAFSGGVAMAGWGLIFHFLIAFACTAFFFLLYPQLPFLKGKIGLNSLLIGIVAWLVTNLAILPLANTPPVNHSSLSVIKSVLILILCIGWPVSYMANRYYRKKLNLRNHGRNTA